MNNSIRLLIAKAAVVAAGTCAVAAPAFAEIVVVEPSAPPPVERVEVVPAPRVGYAWDKGHWRWDHGRYVWIAGHWQAERVGYHWVPGHWIAHGPNWHWVEGHWAA
ncbi:YXWGXW repeat-containing protein [Paraburkholderia bannensis]|uniref:YXWGXW repeat-containing protein n=1 Tax=Paraburkholderia bannensis TaxID=765414 RepID=UPI000484F079|nr:YXWGXW repeat-containing protein [Paraburkholderia bannensis]